MSDWGFDPVIVNDISYTPVEWANAHLGSPIGIDHPDAPPASTPKIKSYSTEHHVSDWDDDTKTVYVKVLDYPISQRSLSDLIGQFRQDGHPQIKFCKVILEHGGIATGPNIGVIERSGFVRDKIGEFTFTYDYANPRRKQDFTPILPPPEPERDAFETELNSIRERQAFCQRNNIRFLQDELDRALWLESKIAEEKVFKEITEMRGIDAAIEAAKAAVEAHAASMKSGKS